MMTAIRSTVSRGAGLALFLALAGAACQQAAAPPTPPAPTPAEMIARGHYLVTIGGCNDCHTPWKMGANGPEPDMSRMLSGHPETLTLPAPSKPSGPWNTSVDATFTSWSGPWGISYTANITPDQNTGIGIWDEAIFFKTMREGRHMGDGRPLLPPMPWFNYGKMTDEDLRAVFTYLKSIPPVSNRVPEPVINEPPQ
jgi:mono/diheme cytochrome c family protein